VKLAAWLMFAAIAPGNALAQSYPAKPIRFIVGPGPDALARVIGQQITQAWGQPVIIDQRGGGGGTISAEAVARAAPDGYTLLLVAPANAINASLYDRLNYNFMRDIEPVAGLIRFPNVVVVNPSLPFKTIPELIAYAKANPGKINMASSSSGTSTHLSGELFKSLAGVDILHVPYRGSSQALIDVIGGQVTMLFDNAPSSLPFVQQGKLRALAVTSTRRLPNLPDIPTLEETGVSGYESLSWSGIVAPAGTPRAVIAKLNAAIERILKTEDVRRRFADMGVEPVGGTPEDFATHIRAESDKWGKLIRSANITVS